MVEFTYLLPQAREGGWVGGWVEGERERWRERRRVSREYLKRVFRRVEEEEEEVGVRKEEEEEEGWVRHVWFYGWRDFGVPEEEEEEEDVVLGLAQEAAGRIREGQKVVIACHSGRGRSGTLAALVAGLLYDVRSVNEMVDLIVTMRLVFSLFSFPPTHPPTHSFTVAHSNILLTLPLK